MTKDQLSPEDRALHDSFFEAYREKYNEQHAAATPEADISLDLCTVHAIRVCIDQEIDRRHREAIARIEEELDRRSLEMIPPIEAPRIVSAVGVGVKVRPPEGAD